jgi:type IV pilus assembly protein PilF
MKMGKLVLIAATSLLIATGCISTTTGPAKSNPDDLDAADLNYQLGARYYRNGSYELARDRLLLSIELNPKKAIVYSTLALTYEQLGNTRLATEAYERAVKVAPRNFDVQNAYAVFLCRYGDYAKARKYFDRAIRVTENDNAEIMMTNAGVCMAQKPDAAAAESYFRQALERRPNYGEALLQMSVLKHSSGDNLGARAFLERFLAANKATPGVLYLGVQIEDGLGNKRARTEYADQILREFPNSAEARRILETS